MAIEIKVTTESPEEVQMWGRFLAGLAKPEPTLVTQPVKAEVISNTPVETQLHKDETVVTKPEPESTNVISAEAKKRRKELNAQFRKIGDTDKAAATVLLKELGASKVSDVKDEQFDEWASLMEAYNQEDPERQSVNTDESTGTPKSDESAEPKHTIDDLRKIAVEVTSGKPELKEQFRKILTDAGVKGGVGDVPSELIDEVHAKVKALAK